MDFPIQLFMRACVASYARAEQVDAQALALGLAEINGAAAARYLSDQPGRAWSGTGTDGLVAIALLSSRLCTVFVHEGSGERLREGIERWLPPEDSGVTYSTEVVPTEAGLTSTAYKISYGGAVKEIWVLTVASQVGSLMRAIISYQGQ